MKKYLIILLVLIICPVYLMAQFTVSGSNGADGTYTSLTTSSTGVFARINAASQSGRNIIVRVTGNSTTEPGSVSLGAGLWTSLTIYPTVAGATISGNVNNALIGLNGSDKVTIDGRVNQAGSSKDLSIINSNTGTGATTIRIITSAENNIIRYCNIQGSTSSTTRGIIFFGTATSGNGNSGNTIEYNNISSYNNVRPRSAIFSAGTSGYDNKNNTISNNNIFNFLNRGSLSHAIHISTANTAWTITGNSFYESSSFVPTANTTYYIIRINSTAGSGYIISDNHLGGSAALCGGSAWTKTSAYNNIFFGIHVTTATGNTNIIKNNTIRNFSWSNITNGNWTAIHIASGDADIGTSSGNTIGSATGNSSITLTNTTTGGFFYGIAILSFGSVDCNDNTIGAITTGNTSQANATNLIGIYKNSTTGSVNIKNNRIGSTSTTNSLNASSGSTVYVQRVFGINNLGTGTIIISDNTVSNLTNSTTNITTTILGEASGISSENGVNTVTGNLVHTLENRNANINATSSCSVSGINLTSSTLKDVSRNTIYNLTNSYSSFTGSIIGLIFTGGTGGNTVSSNFIHSLYGNPNAIPSIYGIRIISGISSFINNIVNISAAGRATIYGIYEPGSAGNNNTLLFNSVYIGGNVSSGTERSYALYSAAANNTRDFRNNILVNKRSTTGGSNLHYAIWLNSATITNLTLDYNDYFASGTGGVLGRLGTQNKTALPIITGGDASSYAIDPLFVLDGSNVAEDYKIGQPLLGVSGTGITTDFGAFSRPNPTMGAWEAPVNTWIGTTNTSWNTSTNWAVNVPLGSIPDLIFDESPVNQLELEQNRLINNITNGQGDYPLVLNGYRLTLTGVLNLTGGGQIDASANNSTIEFAGTTSQSLPSGGLTDNQAFNIIVNNASNVVVNGTLSILNSITASSGRLDAISNSPTMSYAGTSVQSLTTNLYLNDRIYNLSIDNTTGVNLNSSFIIDNDLTISSGCLFNIVAPSLLTVTGNILNNSGIAGLVIRSSGNGSDAKLINNTASVPATVELSLSGGTGISGPRFHYIIPPVLSLSIDNSSPAATGADLGMTYFDGDLLQYDETKALSEKNHGWQYFDGYDFGFGPTTPFYSLTSSRGYNIHIPNSAGDKITFTGLLNGPAHTFSLDYTPANPNPGWNLIGNPYPCNYDLNGIDKLTGSNDGVENTVYYNNDGGYTYWNLITGGSTGYSDIIAPMQGFFVHVTSATATSLTLPVEYKTSSSALPSRSKGSLGKNSASKNSIKKVKLLINSESLNDETIVCLIGDATHGFDGEYDAYKFHNVKTEAPSFYSEIGSTNYAINAIPEPDGTENSIVPLTINIKKAGTYTISASEFENLDNIPVALKHGAIETKLGQGATYTFNSEIGTIRNFKLVFGKSGAGTNKTDLRPEIVTWYSNDYLYINPDSEVTSGTCDIIITDIQGKKIFEKRNTGITSGQTNQIPVNLQRGIYMVHIVANNQPFVSKIVVL